MRKTILYLFAAAVLCTSPVFTSCKEEPTGQQGTDDSNPDDSVNPDEPSVFTPEEAKVYLEETANKAADLLAPESHRVLRDFSLAFLEEYEDYDIDVIDDSDDGFMVAPMKIMAKALAIGDYDGLTRAVEEYDFKFENFTGVYEPDRSRRAFVKTASATDRIEIKCPVSGKDSRMVVKKAGESWRYSYEEEDRYDTYRYNYTIPETIDVTLTWGGETILTAQVNSDYDASAKTARLYTTVTTANLEVTRNIDITNTQIKYHIELKVNGTKLAEGDATVDGTNLCDIDMITRFVERYEDGDMSNPIHKLENEFLNTGKATVNLLNRVRINSTVEHLSSISDALDVNNYFDNESESAEVKNRVMDACGIINDNVESLVYLGSSTTPNARMSVDAKKWKSEYGDYGNWEFAPVITFDDGTRYFMDSYFSENNFASTVSLFDNLVKRWISFFEP